MARPAIGGLYGAGTVFKITMRGKLTTLYDVCAVGACSGGSGPYAGLTLAANGDFYGTTAWGGVDGAPPTQS